MTSQNYVPIINKEEFYNFQRKLRAKRKIFFSEDSDSGKIIFVICMYIYQFIFKSYTYLSNP